MPCYFILTRDGSRTEEAHMADNKPHIAAVINVLTNRDEFAAPVEKLSTEQKTEAYAAIHFIEEIAKSRRESLREPLLKITEDQGTQTDKGGFKLPVGDHTVLKEKRTASAPDEKKLMTLLEKKGLPVEQAFDKVTILQPNPSKVAALVETGHLTDDEARDLYKVTWALVVRPGQELEALLENAVPASAAPAPKKRR